MAEVIWAERAIDDLSDIAEYSSKYGTKMKNSTEDIRLILKFTVRNHKTGRIRK